MIVLAAVVGVISMIVGGYTLVSGAGAPHIVLASIMTLSCGTSLFCMAGAMDYAKKINRKELEELRKELEELKKNLPPD